MKANVEKIGLKVGESIGNGIECAASFRVGGTVHRREVQTLLGDQHLDAAAHRILGEFEETSVECGIVILRSSILYVRSSGRGAHFNPFHPDFPPRWSTANLAPDLQVQHLSVHSWIDIKNALKGDEIGRFVDVWCGTRQLPNTDETRATLLQIGQGKDCVGPVLKSETRCVEPFYLNGLVAFAVFRIG